MSSMRYRRIVYFRFAMGHRVEWLDDPGPVHQIVQRRYTDRDILGPVIEYLVERTDDPDWRSHWAIEADVVPVAPVRAPGGAGGGRTDG